MAAHWEGTRDDLQTLQVQRQQNGPLVNSAGFLASRSIEATTTRAPVVDLFQKPTDGEPRICKNGCENDPKQCSTPRTQIMSPHGAASNWHNQPRGHAPASTFWLRSRPVPARQDDGSVHSHHHTLLLRASSVLPLLCSQPPISCLSLAISSAAAGSLTR